MSEENNILQVQGINSKRYGIIAKLAMKDRQLKPLAKTIYSYLCSHAGAGKTTFPSRHTIIADLGISMDSYYTHLKQLKELGYVKVTQERDRTGQFKRSIFTLAESLSNHNSPYRKKPCSDKPCTVKPDTYNKQKEINNSFNNNQSSHVKSETDGQDATEDITQTIEMYTEILKQNIRYEDLIQTNNGDIKQIGRAHV